MRCREDHLVLVMSLVAVSFFTTSCKEPVYTDPWTTEIPDGAVQLLVEPEGRNKQFHDVIRSLPRRNEFVTPSRFVVRSSEQWAETWAKLRTPLPAPIVDFDSEMVIVEALGLVAPPWEFVSIAGVMESAGQMYVLVYRYGSNPGCAPPTGSDGSPVAMTLVPKREGTPVYLERLAAIRPCPG